MEAAANNAGWCDAVCRAHGLQTRWDRDGWTVTRRSPDGYPDAVTLVPGADARELLRRVQGGTGASVKDSFADLDLAPEGFRVLFEASWIRCARRATIRTPGLGWHEARTPAELEQWSAGHDLDVFAPALLEVKDLHFFGAGGPGAGFALLRTDDVVGISNLWAGDAPLLTVWSDAVAVASQTYPACDLVGYEQGLDLDAAVAAGFSIVGPLRVWMR
jgi:hypothetical protein